MSRQHIYLVLDNSKDGFSIRKIDVGDMEQDDMAADDLDSRARALPDPLFRVEAVGPLSIQSAMHFVALGTRILALQPSPAGAAPVLDTRTMAIAACPLPPADDQHFCRSAFVAVGDSLYSMDGRSGRPGQCNFEVLHSAGSPPSGWSWSSNPSLPPFDPVYVACYAVHPDARSVFFSVYGSRPDTVDPPYYPFRDAGHRATFSLDTETLEWTFRGYWMLPFDGQAFYDPELDAWVGLCRADANHGRVCSCQVLPPAATADGEGDRRQEAPPYKLCKERLFRRKGRRHIGGELVYMGGSTFCVVECVADRRLTREERKQLRGATPPLHLYVRTFGLKYSDKGRLRVATCGRRACCFALPEGTGCGDLLMWTLRALCL